MVQEILVIQKVFNARHWLVASAFATALPNFAISQTVSPVAAVAPAPYKSAFEGYQAYSDDPLVNWREANNDVAQIGGWREYAKQAQQPESPPAAKAGEGKPKAKP